MNDAWIEEERRRELKAEAAKELRLGDAERERRAWVKRSPSGEPRRWLCWRERENGSLDLVTAFYRRKSAQKAARLYERNGTMKGFNF